MLLSRGKKASSGMVMAGFGMLFVGSRPFRAACSTSPPGGRAAFPDTALLGRLVLILIGAAMTVIMQSSSAALVTTLAALHSSAITLARARARHRAENRQDLHGRHRRDRRLGPGETRGARAHHIQCRYRRNRVCHLPPFLGAIRYACAAAGIDDAAMVSPRITAPSTSSAYSLCIRSSRRRTVHRARNSRKGSRLTRNLDASVANVPPVAIETARRTVIGIAAVVMESLRRILNAQASFRDVADDIEEAGMALRETGRFLARVRSQPDSSALHRLHLSILHSVDHLERLVETCREVDEMREVAHHEELRRIALEQLSRIDLVVRWVQGHTESAPLRVVEAMSQSIAGIRRAQRVELLASTARGELEPEDAMSRLEAMRWLDRLAYHVWRAIYHLSEELREQVPLPPGTSPPL